MTKTKVINGTSKPLTLKEGTAGIFTVLKKLQPNDFFHIVVDSNATYREYWCAVKAEDPDGAVVLSSDDCEDLKEVTIIEKVNGPTTSYSWTGVSRKGVRREAGETTTEAANSPKETIEGDVDTTKHKGRFQWLSGLLPKSVKGSSSKSQTGISHVDTV